MLGGVRALASVLRVYNDQTVVCNKSRPWLRYSSVVYELITGRVQVIAIFKARCALRWAKPSMRHIPLIRHVNFAHTNKVP